MQTAKGLASEPYTVIFADDEDAERCLSCGRPGCLLLFYEHDAEGTQVSHLHCLHAERFQEFRDLAERALAVLSQRRKRS